MTTLPTHTLVAFNTATASENKIHDDEVAGALGFGGGLVPGVDVYAYLCHPALAHWGCDLLTRGVTEVRFDSPVYDGETVEIRAELADGVITAEIHSPAGVPATLRAHLDDDPATPPTTRAAAAPPPDERPPASPDSLVAGAALGSFDFGVDRQHQTAYLRDIRDDDSPVAELGLVHPGTLLRQANFILSTNVLLGPWIHVGSVAHHLAPVAVDDVVSVQGVVKANYEHKGHRFIDVDVVMVGADGAPRCWLEHRAIYEPRQVRQMAG